MARGSTERTAGWGVRVRSEVFGGGRARSFEFASRRRQPGEWGSSVGSRRREVAVVLYGVEKRG